MNHARVGVHIMDLDGYKQVLGPNKACKGVKLPNLQLRLHLAVDLMFGYCRLND